jgi:tight adherence protein C
MREKYRRAFPDFMDLLVVCIESGHSLPSALDRVTQEIAHPSPQLGANLHLLNLELRAGSTITTALESLHARLGIDEVQSLAVLLKQSQELGRASADARVFSDDARQAADCAETRANSLPVKMTLPLGLFIFPVILLVLLVPVITESSTPSSSNRNVRERDGALVSLV